MRDLIRKHPIVSFYILAFAIGFVFTIIRLLDPNAMMEFFQILMQKNFHPNIFTTFFYSLERPVLFTGYLFPAAPSIAALIIVAIGWGKPGISNLLSRFRPWLNDVSWRKGLLIYTTMAAMYLALVLYTLLEVQVNGTPGALDRIIDRYSGVPLLIVGFLAIAPFLNHGALFEELGWRGYMQAELLHRYSPLKVVFLIGIFWGLWHLPRDIPGLLTYSEAFVASHGSYLGFLANQLVFVFGTITLSVCIMYAVNLTGGSVLPAIFVHGMSNELSVAIGMGTGTGYQILGNLVSLQDIIVTVAAALILIFVGPQLGYKSAPRLPTDSQGGGV